MRDSRRTRLILVLLLLTALTLITVDYRQGTHSPFRKLRSIAADIFGPIEGAFADVFRPVGHWFAEIGHLGGYQNEISNLRRENQSLRTQVRLGAFTAYEFEQMAALLRLSGKGQFRIVAAHVTAYGSALGYEWTVAIDVGTRDGVHPDLTVVNGDGLVGRVIAAGPTTATVLLAEDPQSYVGARLDSGQLGFVRGNGQRDLTFTLLSAQAPLHVGQRLVTLGSYERQRPYVFGVPIGTVTKVLPAAGSVTRTALVRPFVDFTSVDVVAVVVVPPRVNPRFSLLPASPTPSPTSTPSSRPTPSGTPSGPPSSPSPGTPPATTPPVTPSRTP